MADEVRRARGGAELLRSVGLLPDGPVRWGAPVRSARPGVYIVELPAPLPHAPVDPSHVGAWLDRVATLEMDGQRPTGRDLSHRLAAFWLPDQTVVYVGSTSGSIGRGVAELETTPLGDPAPHADGRWLATFHTLEQARVWWAETDAAEEYADAVLEAFAAGVDPSMAEALHDPTVVVPFANMATPSGLVKEHGITGDLLAAAPEPARAERRVVTLPPGNAVSSEQTMAPRGRATGGVSRARATGDPAGAGTPATRSPAARSTTTRSSAARSTTRSSTAGGSTPRPVPGGARRASARAIANAVPPPGRQPEAVHVTAEGLAQLKLELDELVRVRRPEIIARVRAARELGDLSENADYEAARKEQSFAEGRIAQLEAMIRNASIIEAPAGGSQVALGSTVVVESADGEETFTIVGSSEARPSEGRISNTSPLGRALLGRRPGDDVVVRAPAGDRHFQIRELR